MTDLESIKQSLEAQFKAESSEAHVALKKAVLRLIRAEQSLDLSLSRLDVIKYVKDMAAFCAQESTKGAGEERYW